MAKLTQSQINEVKAKGFLLNKGTECFSGRIVPRGTVFSAENFADMARIAETFGNGKLMATSRQAVEISGIPYEKISEAIAFAEERGLCFGGTGAKVRPVTACKGTTCVFGNCDTHKIAAEIHDTFYIGWKDVKLPHKIKISVGGCPNSCIKPSINDIGIEAHRIPDFDTDKCKGCKNCAVENACPVKAVSMVDGKAVIDMEKCIDCGVCIEKCTFEAFNKDVKPSFRIFLGGTWGKSTKKGIPLSEYVEEKDILPIIRKAILCFRENGHTKERFRGAIDRIGFESVEKAVMGDDILLREREILDREI